MFMNNSITDLECLDKINVSLPRSLVTVFSADILELSGDVWPFDSFVDTILCLPILPTV
jgi:hypothetical protein